MPCIFNTCVSTHPDACCHCSECEVIIEADDEDTIYRVATPSIRKGDKAKDFILLASRRRPCDARCLFKPTIQLALLRGENNKLSFLVHSRDPYLIALRSVTLPTHPPTEDHTRGEVLCAGFTILEESSCVTKV